MKRPAAAGTRRYEFADLVLDMGRRQLLRGNETIALTKLTYRLLCELVTRAPDLVPYEMLAAEVWGAGRVVTPENLAQRIMMLRRSLGDSAEQPRYIEGVRGHGYRLIPEVAELSGQSRAQTTAVPAAHSPLPNSIAVLPFQSLSSGQEDAHLTAGIHSEIISQLATLAGINTVSESAVAAYAGKTKPIEQVAGELNVETILEGAVQVDGSDVRIRVRLIDPSTRTSLWAESYDRKLEDVFDVRTDIALNVARSLEAELTKTESSKIERRPTRSPEAYALYLQAVGLRTTPAPGEKMHEALNRAIELDPEFAEAYGLAAYLYSSALMDTSYGDAASPSRRSELEQLVRDYSSRALALNPRLAIAMAAVAAVEMLTWHWSAAQKMIANAHELGWNTDQLPWVRAWFGEYEEAVDRARRMVETNPNDWGAHRDLGVSYAYAGDHRSAIGCFERSVAMAPSAGVPRAWLVYAQVALGRHEEAREGLELIEGMLDERGAVVYLPELAYCYGRIGEKAAARRIFDRISEISEQREIGAGTWAMAHLAVGDEEAALRWLGKAAENARNHVLDTGLIGLMNLKMNFTADPVLEQPEFAAALEKIRGD